MLVHQKIRTRAALFGYLFASSASTWLTPAMAIEAINLEAAPHIVRDGGCNSADSTSFGATYERRGVFDDTTWAQDRYTEYLLDGSGQVLDARSRLAPVNTWQRVTAVLKTSRSPRQGPFEIVIYEEADAAPPFAKGERADLEPSLVRQRAQFDAHGLDADCPAAR